MRWSWRSRFVFDHGNPFPVVDHKVGAVQFAGFVNDLLLGRPVSQPFPGLGQGRVPCQHFHDLVFDRFGITDRERERAQALLEGLAGILFRVPRQLPRRLQAS